MVVFVDYEAAALPSQDHDSAGSITGSNARPHQNHTNNVTAKSNGVSGLMFSNEQTPDSVHPDRRGRPASGSDAGISRISKPYIPLSAALSCYPIAKEMGRSIDQNTLHALSMTCRQVRSALLPLRNQMLRVSLRCQNEVIMTSRLVNLDIPIRAKNLMMILESFENCGTFGRCARDMVAECQRCSVIVCRNCVPKPHGAAPLISRLYRLCSTCLAVPLSHYSSATPQPNHHIDPNSTSRKFEPDTDACKCDDGYWFCRACRDHYHDDSMRYRRAWTHINSDDAYLNDDPFYWGFGKGSCGVQCARKENCLAAADIEVEVNAQAEDQVPSYHSQFRTHASRPRGDHLGREIVGTDDVAKQKAMKKIRVGANVLEQYQWESHLFITPNVSGDFRRWCGWCSKVIPSDSEAANLASN